MKEWGARVGFCSPRRFPVTQIEVTSTDAAKNVVTYGLRNGNKS